MISKPLFVAKQLSFRLRHTDVVSFSCFVQLISKVNPRIREVNSQIVDAACINQGSVDNVIP